MKPTVLTIDDDPVVRKLVKKAVEGMGYESVEVPSGIEGLNYLEKAIPQLILLDAMMPVVNGFEVLKKIKDHKEWRSIPVMMFTAVSQEEKVKEAVELGAVDYLLKPFRLQAVREKVHSILGDGEKGKLAGRSRARRQAAPKESSELPSIVMVVSGDRITQNRFYRLLQDNGIRSIKAPTSLEGLRLLESSTPDMIILDNNLKVFTASEMEKKIRASSNWKQIPVLRIAEKHTEKGTVISSTISEEEFLDRVIEIWEKVPEQRKRQTKDSQAKSVYRIVLMSESEELHQWFLDNLYNSYEMKLVENSSDLISLIIDWDPDFVLVNYPDYETDSFGILKRCQDTLGGGNLRYYLFSRRHQPEEVFKQVRNSGFERLIVFSQSDTNLVESLNSYFGVNLVQESVEDSLVILKRKPTLSNYAGREMLHRIMAQKRRGMKKFLLDFTALRDISFNELEYLGRVTNYQTKLGIKLCIVTNSKIVTESFRSFQETESVKIFETIREAKSYLC